MADTLRDILTESEFLYSEYKDTYHSFNSPRSMTQRKIVEHARVIVSLSSRLDSLNTVDAARTLVNEEEPAGINLKKIVETALHERRSKLEFRQREAIHGTDEIVDRSSQFYQHNQDALYRLGVIEAELDGIDITQTT